MGSFTEIFFALEMTQKEGHLFFLWRTSHSNFPPILFSLCSKPEDGKGKEKG